MDMITCYGSSSEKYAQFLPIKIVESAKVIKALENRDYPYLLDNGYFTNETEKERKT